jgi:hypothetical protein
MNKAHFKTMRVTSVKVSVDGTGVSNRIKKGLCLINITEIQTAFEDELTGQLEIVMKSGDRFFVKNLTLVEIEQIMNGLNK